MRQWTRRGILAEGARAAAGWAAVASLADGASAADGPAAKFTLDLRCGAIGVAADQLAAIRLAHAHGFESVTPEPEFLAELSEPELAELPSELSEKQLVWGAAGLPVEFRRDEQAFREGLADLPRLARALERAGVTRIGTWLGPAHSELTYLANFRQHVARLGQCAAVLGDHGLRFGLEYVGPKTSWSRQRYPFIHTMAETKDLIAEIGSDNMGLVLDSWHWYTAHETAADLRTLSNRDIVACDLNDAPAGVPIDQQRDNRRELPATTGVIDLKSFLQVLVDLQYDGPIRAEPFNRALDELGNEQAVAATAAAMRTAFALVGR